MKTPIRKILLVVPFLSAVAFSGIAAAQQPPVVGRQAVPLGVTVEEMVVVAKGWSVKKELIGKQVYNDKGEKIGSIDDVILSPDKSASFTIIGTGGFVGLGRHDLAIPFGQLEVTNNRIVLPNATKEALKALPPFQYAK
ncbi:MAG: photosystem reaction center subunit [Myxococcales bacterium]|nr:photosystem reaction center subunit [Myxococcales bacterium]